jgi:predicted DCC family thiol-disulfide oxidoreductase YuxK
MAPESNERRIVLFDGVCNLCNAAVRFIIKRDPKARFSFGALQSQAAQELLRGTDLKPEDLRTVIYLAGDQALVRSSAALTILRDLGGLWSLAYGFMIVPRPIRDLLYGLIAKYRYKWFGQQETCMVPTPDLRSRFLDD